MLSTALVIERPEHLSFRDLPLPPPGEDQVVVAVEWSGISTGTERLLYTGRMPPFPGMGYPLIPGYEAVGRVVEAGPQSGRAIGERVFIAGARCFEGIHHLFGATASHLVVPGSRAFPLAPHVRADGVLLALAATAFHAGWGQGATPPQLIVGHGALGRLIARIAVALAPDAPPTVWEVNPSRQGGAAGYTVVHPDADPRRDYAAICDASGDIRILDSLIQRLAPGREVTLAGFYHTAITFDFIPAFLREIRLRIAAEWKPDDLGRVVQLVNAGTLALDGIITHERPARAAIDAYPVAFDDPDCVKMILDWREAA